MFTYVMFTCVTPPHAHTHTHTHIPFCLYFSYLDRWKSTSLLRAPKPSGHNSLVPAVSAIQRFYCTQTEAARRHPDRFISSGIQILDYGTPNNAIIPGISLTGLPPALHKHQQLHCVGQRPYYFLFYYFFSPSLGRFSATTDLMPPRIKKLIKHAVARRTTLHNKCRPPYYSY